MNFHSLSKNINFPSLFSPKVGGDPEEYAFNVGIRELCSLMLSEDKTLLVYAKITSIIHPFIIAEKMIEYYGKVLNTNSLNEDITDSAFLIDTCVISEYYEKTGLEVSGDELLTFGIKAQLAGDNKILITWLKAEIDYSQSGNTPTPID